MKNQGLFKLAAIALLLCSTPFGTLALPVPTNKGITAPLDTKYYRRYLGLSKDIDGSQHIYLSKRSPLVQTEELPIDSPTLSSSQKNDIVKRNPHQGGSVFEAKSWQGNPNEKGLISSQEDPTLGVQPELGFSKAKRSPQWVDWDEEGLGPGQEDPTLRASSPFGGDEFRGTLSSFTSSQG